MADIKAMEERFVKATAKRDVNAIMSFYVPDDGEDTLALFPGPIETSMSDLDVTAAGGDLAFGHGVQHMTGKADSASKA